MEVIQERISEANLESLIQRVEEDNGYNEYSFLADVQRTTNNFTERKEVIEEAYRLGFKHGYVIIPYTLSMSMHKYPEMSFDEIKTGINAMLEKENDYGSFSDLIYSISRAREDDGIRVMEFARDRAEDKEIPDVYVKFDRLITYEKERRLYLDDRKLVLPRIENEISQLEESHDSKEAERIDGMLIELNRKLYVLIDLCKDTISDGSLKENIQLYLDLHSIWKPEKERLYYLIKRVREMPPSSYRPAI